MNPKAPMVVVIASLLTGEVLMPEHHCDLAAPPESAASCEIKREQPHIEPEALRLQAPLPSAAPPLPTGGVMQQVA